MNAKTFHEAQGARYGPIRHGPHDHVHAFRRQADEVPEIVMGGLCLRKRPVGLLLGGMDQVGELDGILNEEHRNIVADKIPVAFLRVELDREATHVTRKVG
jgi:hypothetical protein